MDQKRFLTFIVVSMGILIGWNAFIMPRFQPPKKPKAAQNQAENKADKAGQQAIDKAPGENPELADRHPAIGAGEADEGDVENADSKAGENAAAKSDGEPSPAVADKPNAEGPPDEKQQGQENPKKAAAPQLPKFPNQTVELGSDEFQTGYRQLVKLTSQGAAVQQIELNDPRYRSLTKNAANVHPPLVVVGNGAIFPRTFDVDVPEVNADLDTQNWELVEVLPRDAPHSTAVFRLTLDGLQVEKRYDLPMIERKGDNVDEAPAYSLAVDLTFRNLGKAERTVTYILQGPLGLPLENVENTQKFRDVVVGFQSTPDAVDNEIMAAKAIAGGKVEKWQKAIRYIGVDAQFFAALVCPIGDQLKAPYIDSVKQQLIGPNREEKSEISVQLTSVALPLSAAGAADGKDSVTHSYHLFAGPKRDDVLPAGAAKVIDFGWFHWVSRPMLSLLKTFHRIFGSWGISIICLTIVVRGAMFPVSIKTARNAAKMQALKPEMAALDQKYANDKEKLARAKMELFRKHGHNPAAGCLPLFLQLPIFMGLYQALNHAVDLRMASFLWIDNLAAPDALFRMPFALPMIGQEFNLLPLITTLLFYVQQKMFMPPPTNEQEAMQMKMMNFMMIFMGVMFYKVPAGLCVYFIASSLWGMAERKLLPKAKPVALIEPPPEGPSSSRRKPRDDDGTADVPDGRDGGGGFWSMLLKAAEKETSARRSSNDRRK